MPDYDILSDYELDEDILKDSLDFLMQGAEIEETTIRDGKGVVKQTRTRVKRTPDTVIKSLMAADIITGGSIGIARAGLLGGRHHKMIKKTTHVVIPHDEVDMRVVSYNRPLPGKYKDEL